MELLDDLTGFGFEDVIEDVFRTLGYENVRQTNRRTDAVYDVLMEAVLDGDRTAIIVACEHAETVERSVVEELHEAVATYDFDGPSRGMVVTSGRFTVDARGYAERLAHDGDPYPVTLVDGEELRAIGEEVGMDLYNGRIEIVCDETLRPYDSPASLAAPVEAAFGAVENVDAAALPSPSSRVTFRPVCSIAAMTDATFEESVGVVHRINERTRFVVHADRDGPSIASPDIEDLVTSNLHRTVPLDEDRYALTFDAVTVRRFGQTETEHKNWAVDQLRAHHGTSVAYTDENDVTRRRRCEPDRSAISILAITPVYLPHVRLRTVVNQHTYIYEYVAAGGSRVTQIDEVRRCVHCGVDRADETYTFCANCGSVNCERHTKTERVDGTPVCTGCAVTGRFALKQHFFYDDDNRDAFRETYAAMPLHRKAMVNPPLTAGVLLAAALLVVALLVAVGLFRLPF